MKNIPKFNLFAYLCLSLSLAVISYEAAAADVQKAENVSPANASSDGSSADTHQSKLESDSKVKAQAAEEAAREMYLSRIEAPRSQRSSPDAVQSRKRMEAEIKALLEAEEKHSKTVQDAKKEKSEQMKEGEADTTSRESSTAPRPKVSRIESPKASPSF